MDVHPGVWVAAGIFGFFPLIIGYMAGVGGQNNPGTITVGTNTSNPSCDQARADFEARRQERCRAKIAEEAAKRELDAMTAIWATFVAALATATGAAFAALALPWPVNLVVSLIAWTVVTALAIIVAYYSGRKVTAGNVWGAASQALRDANEAVLEARNAVVAACPPDIANQTLALPDPCDI